MDYFFWGVLEARTNRAPHKTKDSLIASIKLEAGKMETAQVKAACSRFRGRVEAVVAAGGDYID